MLVRNILVNYMKSCYIRNNLISFSLYRRIRLKKLANCSGKNKIRQNLRITPPNIDRIYDVILLVTNNNIMSQVLHVCFTTDITLITVKLCTASGDFV